MPTNGICAEAAVLWEKGYDKLPIIQVTVLNTNNYGFYEEEVPEDYGMGWVRKVESGTCLYYAPTNPSPPIVQIRDAAGRELVLRSSAPVLSNYPNSFSLSYAKSHKPDPRTLFPVPLTHSAGCLAWFGVGDVCDIPKPGEYTLTAWAKIYKRASDNDDLCRRIDLPPVEVTIKWAGSNSGQSVATNSPSAK
jgi:hypothetical protein